MTPRKPDRALTKALAELRHLRAEDRLAILELLEPFSRLRVERLLSGRDGGREPASRDLAAAFVQAGYSSWLLGRLQSTDGSGGMTAAGANLLREAAEASQSATDAARDNLVHSRAGRFSGLLRRRERA